LLATQWMIWGSIPGRGWEYFSSPPRLDRLWGPPSLLSNGYQGFFPWGVTRPGRETDNLPPSSAEVKNAWSYPSTSQYAFMAYCSIKGSTGTTLPLEIQVSLCLSIMPWKCMGSVEVKIFTHL